MAGLQQFPFYIEAWRSGTRGLTAPAALLYLDIILDIYDAAGPVAVDPIDKAAVLRIRPSSARKALEELVVKGKIIRTVDGQFWCEKCGKVIAGIKAKSTKAKASVEAREALRNSRAGPSSRDKSRNCNVELGIKSRISGNELGTNPVTGNEKTQQKQGPSSSNDHRTIIERSSVRARSNESESERERPPPPYDDDSSLGCKARSSSSSWGGDFERGFEGQKGAERYGLPGPPGAQSAEVIDLHPSPQPSPTTAAILAICHPPSGSRGWSPPAVDVWVNRCLEIGWYDEELIEAARLARQGAGAEPISSINYLTGVLRNLAERAAPAEIPEGGPDVRTSSPRPDAAERAARRTSERDAAADAAVAALVREYGSDPAGAA